MFTCQLFNALHRVDNNVPCSDLLLTLVTSYPDLIDDNVKHELGFLMDTEFSKDFRIIHNKDSLLHITRDDYDLVVNTWSWSEREVGITLNGHNYTATYEKYKDLVAIICESEVVAVFNIKYIS